LGRFLPIISSWLGFSTTTHGNLLDQLFQFRGLGGFLKNVCFSLNNIDFMWFGSSGKSSIDAIFQHKKEHMQALIERVSFSLFGG